MRNIIFHLCLHMEFIEKKPNKKWKTILWEKQIGFAAKTQRNLRRIPVSDHEGELTGE